MNRDEAHELAYNSQYARVIGDIKSLAKQGYFSSIQEELTAGTINQLRDEGYYVEDSDSPWVVIKW